MSRTASGIAIRAWLMTLTGLVAAWSMGPLGRAQEEEKAGKAERKASTDGEKPAPVEGAADAITKREPFDKMTLRDGKEERIVEVQPLTGFGNPRTLPANPKPTDKVKFQLMDDEEEVVYEVVWRNIVKIEFFEDLVAAEAKRLVGEGKLDDAFDHLMFVKRYFPKYQKLEAVAREYLYRSGEAALAAGNSTEALALFEEVAYADRDYRPTARGVPAVDQVAVAAGPLVADYIKREDYRSAQRLITRLSKKHGLVDAPFYKDWVGKLDALAAAERDVAKDALGKKRYVEAYDATARMMKIWPEVAGGKELAERIAKIYPLVIVGTNAKATRANALSIDNWAARRAGRLTQRMLMDFDRITSEGGQYRFAFGRHVMSDDGIQFTLKPDLPSLKDEQRRQVSLDLANRLLVLADNESPTFSPAWARVLRSAAVGKGGEIVLDLNYAHVNPAALIQTPLDASASSAASLKNPYLMTTDAKTGATRFLYNPEVPLASPSQPKEVYERTFADPPAALVALKQGEIDMVDRILPGDLAEIRGVKEIVVERYAVPCVHVLLPNTKRKYTANATFRRALLHGIAREPILQKGLMRDVNVPGCQVVSGPFPAPTQARDPLAYAYDESLKPLAFDPLLSLTLMTIADRAVKSKERKDAEARGEVPPEPEKPPEKKPEEGEEGEEGGEKPPKQMVSKLSLKLTLAHPAEEMARVACKSIARQWQVLGIETTLKELPEGETSDPTEDYDLLFAELQIWEPVIQAAQVVGPQGLARSDDPFIGLALRRVEAAKNWGDVSTRLRELHGLIQQDVTLLPLWQIVHHMAYRKSVQGVRKAPASAYDNLIQWKVASRLLKSQ